MTTTATATAATAAAAKIAEIADYAAWELARIADVPSGTARSDEFLDTVRVNVVEMAAWVDADQWEREAVEDYSGRLSEAADGAIATYDAELWEQFVGLRAWQEEDAAVGAAIKDAATEALSVIAQRLAKALAEKINEAVGDYLEAQE